MKEPQLIKDWIELSRVPASKTHKLQITTEHGNGWIVPLIPNDDDFIGGKDYLSTHTFYGKTHIHSTKKLQACGFNIVLANWDK